MKMAIISILCLLIVGCATYNRKPDNWKKMMQDKLYYGMPQDEVQVLLGNPDITTTDTWCYDSFSNNWFTDGLKEGFVSGATEMKAQNDANYYTRGIRTDRAAQSVLNPSYQQQKNQQGKGKYAGSFVISFNSTGSLLDIYFLNPDGQRETISVPTKKQ